MKKTNIVVVMNNEEEYKVELGIEDFNSSDTRQALELLSNNLNDYGNRFITFNDNTILNLDLVSAIYIEELEVPPWDTLEMPLQVMLPVNN